MEKEDVSLCISPSVITAGTARSFKLQKKNHLSRQDNQENQLIPTSGFNKQMGGLVNMDKKAHNIQT